MYIFLVDLEVVGRAVHIVAYLTLHLLGSLLVGSDVALQIALEYKFPATNVTGEAFEPLVDAVVAVEVLLSGKLSATSLAVVRLLPRVHQHVNGEILLQGKLLPTHVTHIRLNSAMCEEVSVK